MANKGLLAIAGILGLGLVLGGGGSQTPAGCAVDLLPTPTPFKYFELNGATWGDNNPVIVAFHGMGGKPDPIAALIETNRPVKIIAPRGFNTYYASYAWWLERAASEDQATLAAQMKWAADEIAPLFKQIRRCNPNSRIVSVGHSQGGMMAFNTARFVPEVDRAVGGSGWLPAELQGPMRRTIAVHGNVDDTVPFERTRDWILGLGSPHKFVEVNASHGISGPLLEAWRQAVNEAIA